jgi:hypothetical protein
MSWGSSHMLCSGTHVSMVEMKGFGFGSISVASGIPATTGSKNHGPNLRELEA